MSWKDCAAAIRSAAGRDLTDDQVADVFEAVDRRKKALEAEGRIDGLDQRLREAVAEDAERVRIDAALAKKHAALSVLARDRATRHVEALVEAGVGPAFRWSPGNKYRNAVLAMFEGTTRGVEGGRHSIAATKQAYFGRYVGTMQANLIREVPHVEGMLRDRAFLDDVVREMMELRENGAPGRTGNTDAQKVAKVLADAAEMSRTDLNRLGANIGRLDGWAGSQIHDADRIGTVTKDAWIDAILPKLDLDRTFEGVTDPAEVRRILGNVWENIVFQPDRGAPSPGDGFVGPRNVARALERHRVLHFKSADDWLSYSQQFGHGHIFDGMVGHLSKAALNASQMEMLGPNPGATLDAVLDGLRRRVDRDDTIPPAEKAKVKASLRADAGLGIGAAFRIASGASLIPTSRTIADVAGSIRAVQSLGKLGGATVSSITDLPTAVLNLRFNGLSFGEAIAQQIGGILAGRGKGEARELAYLIGEGFEGLLGHIVSPHVANDSTPGAMQSAMSHFFRWTGLTWWTDANRASVARILSANLGGSAHLPFGELNPRLQHVLSQHAITPDLWDAIRTHGATQIEGRTYLSPEGIAAMPDDAARAFGRSAADGRRTVELALRRYFADEARSSVLEADAATQRFTTAGLSRGTVPGEAIRFIMQFKGYPIAFTQRVLGRAWQGGAGGASAGGAHIGALIAGTLVMGYAAMTAKDALRGYTPREVVDEDGVPRLKTILAALTQGGGLGIAGDFLFGEVSRSGNTALETAAGPAAGEIAGWLNLYGKARSGEASAGEVLSRALASTPFINIWYLRPALNYLVLNELREALSPGYLTRQDQRRRQDYGQEPFQQPYDRIGLDLF
ncbi:hypothetical protein M0638_26975 [Roseomonas sp. NAR14]|uniref:Uncharacterized protein n=1 Tax=Roseomonas acroporae TaxID=2937791 RepID=A0A9X1YCP2_9PROT|nr:hypothetical protein [Roseomonas acroporae]MCK8788004.1 hypothetical protein [Roseomonas acroporae]